jgi:hypothetical protein
VEWVNTLDLYFSHEAGTTHDDRDQSIEADKPDMITVM